GTSCLAVSTVLSIFFLGLGIGSLWGGRLADRTSRPLWIYGILEIVIGLWAVLFILLIDSSEAAVVGTLRVVGHSRALGIAVRALLACAFLIVPVTLMGATLPLLAKYVTRQGPLRGFRVGALYSLNTFGAVLGCALAGFYLLEHLGFTRATLVGAAFNIGIGVASLALHRVRYAEAPGEFDDKDTTVTTSTGEPVGPVIAAVAVFAFAVSGFCSLGLEVLWTRLLAIVFTGTTYAFTTMLTTVLCGIAVGSTLASALIDRVKHATSFFGAVQVLTGVACLLTLMVFPSLPDRLREMQLQFGFSWESTIRAKVFLSFLVLFPPTFFFGMSFPAIIRIVLSSRARLGGQVGRVYSANTLGGVLGAIAGGFLIIPALGTHNGIVLLASLLCATGLLLLVVCPTRSRFAKTALILFSIAGIGGSVMALPDDVSRALNRWYIPSDHEVIFFTEGVEGTVVVTAPTEEDHGTDRYLWINAVQATASIEKGVKMNRLQGVLPLLFDRDPQTALFMCFRGIFLISPHRYF
ncbi:MAG: fused MFS/spermidine synthase, partial [Candidatus Hydrogenedentes bacterium]|nr:fused MFS/spermidine synthase [Candidatus Hydrogenedentota bacterium]